MDRSGLHPVASGAIQAAASGALTVAELRKRLDEESRAADDVEGRLEEMNRDHAIIQGTMSHQRRKRQNTLDPVDRQLVAARAELERLQAELHTIDGRLANDEQQVRTYEAAKRAQAIRYAEAFVPRITTREDQLLADAVAHEKEEERARRAQAERTAAEERRREEQDAAEAAAAAQAAQAADAALEKAKAAASTSARIPRTGSRGRPGGAPTAGDGKSQPSERPRRRRSTSVRRAGEAEARKAPEGGNRPRPPNASQRRSTTRASASTSQGGERLQPMSQPSQSATSERGPGSHPAPTAASASSSVRSDASTRRHARHGSATNTTRGAASSLRVGIAEPFAATGGGGASGDSGASAQLCGDFGSAGQSQLSPGRRKSRSGRPPKAPGDSASPRRRSRASQRHRPEDDSSLEASNGSPKNPELDDTGAAAADATKPPTPEPDVGGVVPYVPRIFDHARVYGTYYEGAAHPCRRDVAPDYAELERVRRVAQQQAEDEARIERDRQAFEASRASVKEMLRRVAPLPPEVARTRPRPPSAPLAPLAAGDRSAIAWRPELNRDVEAAPSLSSARRPVL